MPCLRLTQSATVCLMLCATLALVGSGCGDSRGFEVPTAPSPPPPAPGPRPGTFDVSGAWAGTKTVVWDPIDGGGSCSRPAIATLTQSNGTVTGLFTDPGCGAAEDQYRLEGRIEGDVLTGRIVFPSFTWVASGRVTGDQLRVGATNVTWDLHR